MLLSTKGILDSVPPLRGAPAPITFEASALSHAALGCSRALMRRSQKLKFNVGFNVVGQQSRHLQFLKFSPQHRLSSIDFAGTIATNFLHQNFATHIATSHRSDSPSQSLAIFLLVAAKTRKPTQPLDLEGQHILPNQTGLGRSK